MTETVVCRGLVTKTQSGFFTVRTAEHGDIVSRVRGRLLQERLDTDPVALGDWVMTSLLDDGTGMIESVEPRLRALVRQMPSPEGRRGDTRPIDREQVIIANPDQVIFVFAVASPAPNRRMLDRFIVMAEKAEIPIVICVNKCDLVPPGKPQALFGLYKAIGYPVIYTSAINRDGLDELQTALTGRISALSGPSGAGKSSLLNAIQPGLGLQVKSISKANAKGRHTTVSSQLYSLAIGGYLADTPGIRALGLSDVEPGELDAYFIEMGPLVDRCKFNNCRHEHEPGCAVIEAVQAGAIAPERYESFVRLREELEALYSLS